MTDHQITPPLSPAAQAVLDAFNDANDGHYEDGIWHPSEPEIQLAAALRAAADYIDDASDGLECQDILLQIADELEGQ